MSRFDIYQFILTLIYMNHFYYNFPAVEIVSQFQKKIKIETVINHAIFYFIKIFEKNY